MKVTINDIVKNSGFSRSTVSRALSDSTKVHPSTKEAIQKVMNELNYKHREGSKYISYGVGNKLIALIIGDITGDVNAEVSTSIIERLTKNGYIVSLFISNFDDELVAKYIETANENNFAGLIILHTYGTNGVIELVKNTKLPVVFFNKNLPMLNTDVVFEDNYKGLYLATQHLIDLGHKRIAYIKGREQSYTSAERTRGFMDAMKDYNIKVDEGDVYVGDYLRSEAYEIGKNILQKKSDITAIACENDAMATGLVECFMDNNISVPDEISIIGYDDSPIAVQCSVKLTTVRISVDEIGEKICQMITRRINNNSEAYSRIIIEPKLIIRDSTKNINKLS